MSAGDISILLSVNFNGHVNTIGLNPKCGVCRIPGKITSYKGLKGRRI